MSTQTFPNGQTLESSAINTDTIQALFQQATCLCFGITNKLPFSASLVEGQAEITLDSVIGISVGFNISDAPGFGLIGYGEGGYGEGGNIPPNTTVKSILGKVVTMSNNALATVEETVFVTDPTAGNQVRQAWPVAGAPAWGQNDNVTFVRCTEIDNDYNKVRDEGIEPNDETTATLDIEYTRVWRVFWELRGPTSFDRARLLKTAIQLDFIHDMLAAFNLYLMPNIGNPQRVPELVEGKWWERTDFEMVFYEQVNESTTVSTVASIELEISNKNGVQSDIEVT